MNNKPKKLLFVVNPIAGGKDKQEFIDNLPSAMAEYGCNCEWIYTNGKDDETSLAEAIKKHQPYIVVAVGGDGTCNLVAHAIAGTDLILGIIPMGSANGMATELEIPIDPTKALALLPSGNHKEIDVLVLNKKYKSIHLSDIGINAKLVHAFEKAPGRGLKTYARMLFKQMLNWKQYKIELSYDSIRVKRKVISLTFANARKFGTGAIINPDGKLNDGKFELCMLRAFPWYFLFDLTVRFFKGTIERSPFIEIISCEHAVIRSKKPLLLQVDGEVIGKFNEIEVDVIKGGLKVIVAGEM
jgi:diacylglycerol kinase family enzyme